MKFLNLLLLLFLLAGVASAQEALNPSPAPDVTVLEHSWKSDMVNPSLGEDPLRANEEQVELQRAQIQNQRDNAIRASLGMPAVPPPTRMPNSKPMPRSPYTEYVYQARFQNTGTREIRKLVWEYVFFDPSTQEEVGRRRYESKVNLRPGKTTTVVIRSEIPPTSTINVTQVGKKRMQEQYTQQVVVQSIDYKDGSVWQRHAK